MNNLSLSSVVAEVLVVTLIGSSVLMGVPRQAHAQDAVVVAADTSAPALETAANSAIDVVKNTLTSVNTGLSAVAEQSLAFKAYVLDPIAFITSGDLLKSITASIIGFVNGKLNGTGAPQFVQNLSAHMQLVGDAHAFAFFAQFGQDSNSPFASAIVSSLRTNYLQQTSVAGFLAANECTLDQYSQNPRAFLAGDWSQGGIPEWFALTTQDQNNPYLLNLRAQSELANVVSSAQAARLAELNWSQGLLSWCGPASAGSLSPGSSGQSGSTGTILGDACTLANGVTGTILTPGIVILNQLEKALGSTIDKLSAMGDIGAQINELLGNIGAIMSTVNFAAQIVGGTDSGGLFGSTEPSAGGGPSPLSTYQNSSYFGASQASIVQTASQVPAISGDMKSRLSQYQAAWGTISSAANSASSSVSSLISSCSTQATTVQMAQAALAYEVAPALAQVAQANQIIANANAMLAKVQSETGGSSGALTVDLQTLQAMPPTAADITSANQQAQSRGSATANPPGSLTVSASSLLDQMALINSNAQTLLRTCVPVP